MTRQTPLLTAVLAVAAMTVFAPWRLEKTTAKGVPIIREPRQTASIPVPAEPPQASTDSNGPAKPAQPANQPEPPSRSGQETETAATARWAARQRYLDQVYLLGRLIYGEARGEPYVGQVAVGAVVMNRVESPLFPNTLAGVIYQPGAFDVVMDGQINLAPDREAVKAATEAIGGWDPTGGALYYYNPAKATSYWIWTRPVVLVIGDHYFAH